MFTWSGGNPELRVISLALQVDTQWYGDVKLFNQAYQVHICKFQVLNPSLSEPKACAPVNTFLEQKGILEATESSVATE